MANINPEILRRMAMRNAMAPDATSVAPAMAPVGIANPLPMANPAVPNTPDWMRKTGAKKGMGYLGLLPSIDERGKPSVSSELSFTSGDILPGRDVLIPSMTPNLNTQELQHLLGGKYNVQSRTGIDDMISRKAIDFARQRVSQGKPFFAMPNEEGKYKPLLK